MFRIEFNGAIVVDDGAVHAKNGELRRVAVDRRSEFNGAIVVGDGAVVIALAFFANATEVIVGRGDFRIEFNGAIEVGDRAVVIALGFFVKATVVVVVRGRGSLSCGDSRKRQTQNECDAH